jgi:hypothetical protein
MTGSSSLNYCHVLDCVTLRRSMHWIIVFVEPYIQPPELKTMQPYRWSTPFTVHRHTRIRFLSLHQSYPGNGFIAVPLSPQITHEGFFSKPNFFIVIILSVQIPKTRLNSVLILQGSYPGRLASRNSTKSSELKFSLYHFWRTTQKTASALLWRCVYTLVSKTDKSGSMMFKSVDCAGQGRCWSSPSGSSNHDWTIPPVW